MILTAPTGLYSSELPTGPLDPTSVIYTISDGTPPRDESVYQQIPVGIQKQARLPRIFTQTSRRAVLGDLVYTTKTTSATKATAGAQILAIGQVLDFTDVEQTATTQPASDTITTKHNNNYIDLSDLGLDQADQDFISQQAVDAQQIILAEIGALQKQSSDYESDIVGMQGQVNEATKVLAGLQTIAKTGKDVSLIQARIQIKLSNLQSNLAAVNTAYNAIPDQINSLRDQLTALTDLVKYGWIIST